MKLEKVLSNINIDLKLPEMDNNALVPVGIACAALFSVNVAYRVSKKISRDGEGFHSIFAGFSILSNKESVLKHDQVKDSLDTYEGLFSGARKDVGKINTEDSIKNREKEYKTMVDSFYNLVTDFYEWGWGQVRIFESYSMRKVHRKCIAIPFSFLFLKFILFFCNFIWH